MVNHAINQRVNSKVDVFNYVYKNYQLMIQSYYKFW
jgi:hypothetical protein